jgi:hypothetical protein
VKVEVKRKHIRNGDKCSIHFCALALAISETTDEEWKVGIYYAYKLSNEKRYKLSAKATKFIEHFDQGIKVSPAKFILKEVTK